jgi:uncharacterized protein YkwD
MKRQSLLLGFLFITNTIFTTGALAAGLPRLPVLSPQETPPYSLFLPLIFHQPPPTPTSTPTNTPIPSSDETNEQHIAELINQERLAQGIAPVQVDPALTQASRRHSHDMADNHFTSHTGSDGSTPGQRMSEAGYDWSSWGEIIAWGFGGDAASVVEWWMNSPPHRSIILDPKYKHFGVGYVSQPDSDWGYYWAVDFGIPSSSATLGQQLMTGRAANASGGSSWAVFQPVP